MEGFESDGFAINTAIAQFVKFACLLTRYRESSTGKFSSELILVTFKESISRFLNVSMYSLSSFVNFSIGDSSRTKLSNYTVN